MTESSAPSASPAPNSRSRTSADTGADRPRIFIDKQTPSVFKALRSTATELRERAADAGLSRATLELVNVRVSQINACVYCLDAHTRAALDAGVTTQQLGVLPGWREAALFTDRDRAALEIAEAGTLVTGEHLSDDDYARARRYLSDDEVSLLVWAAILINAFNRVSILSQHPVRPR